MKLLELNDKTYKIPNKVMKTIEDMSNYIKQLEEESKKLKEIESLLESEYKNAPHRITTLEIDLFEIVKRK